MFFQRFKDLGQCYEEFYKCEFTKWALITIYISKIFAKMTATPTGALLASDIWADARKIEAIPRACILWKKF